METEFQKKNLKKGCQERNKQKVKNFNIDENNKIQDAKQNMGPIRKKK